MIVLTTRKPSLDDTSAQIELVWLVDGKRVAKRVPENTAVRNPHESAVQETFPDITDIRLTGYHGKQGSEGYAYSVWE